MASWIIEPRSEHHDRAAFDCDRPSLNDWLRQSASQFERKGLARTYVLVQRGQTRVHGFYALSNCHLACDALLADAAKGLPRRLDIPAVLIGRLAVDRSLAGQGFGSALLIDALRRILDLSARIGIRVVVVDALDDRARGFYLHHEFRPLEDDPGRLFLPVSLIARLGLDPLGA